MHSTSMEMNRCCCTDFLATAEGTRCQVKWTIVVFSRSVCLSLSLSLSLCSSSLSIQRTHIFFPLFLSLSLLLDYSKTLDACVHVSPITITKRKETEENEALYPSCAHKRTPAANYLCYSMFIDPFEIGLERNVVRAKENPKLCRRMMMMMTTTTTKDGQ
jgi:hypothetical protein